MSRPLAVNWRVASAGIVAVAGDTSTRARAPRSTVRFAAPTTPSSVAVIRTRPGGPGVYRPDESIDPREAFQVGVIGSAWPLVSYPLAVNCRVSSAEIVAFAGDT